MLHLACVLPCRFNPLISYDAAVARSFTERVCLPWQAAAKLGHRLAGWLAGWRSLRGMWRLTQKGFEQSCHTRAGVWRLRSRSSCQGRHATRAHSEPEPAEARVQGGACTHARAVLPRSSWHECTCTYIGGVRWRGSHLPCSWLASRAMNSSATPCRTCPCCTCPFLVLNKKNSQWVQRGAPVASQHKRWLVGLAWRCVPTCQLRLINT